MDSEKRFELISRNTEEVLTAEDLRRFLDEGTKLQHYIGFEISGPVHLGTASTAIKIADFQQAKVDCSIYLASWHAWINNKLDGDLDTIERVGVGYFKESMKASLEAFGADAEKVEFISGKELYHHNDEYWKTVVEVSKHLTLHRALRAITIMGRKEGENVDLGSLLYAPMQVADIFNQGIHIAHSGIDQRKAHVIARETAEKISSKPQKPVAVHGTLILGLQKPSEWPVPKERLQQLLSEQKMSKSVPNSSIWLHESEEAIREKINHAFCQERETSFNPVLDWCKKLLFYNPKFSLHVERPAKFGGNAGYHSFTELESDFAAGKLHPMDLKSAVAPAIAKLTAPARKRLSSPKNVKLREELEGILEQRK